MLHIVRYLLWLFSTFLRSLRYRVHLHSSESLRGLRGPTLVLPNHPAYFDPPILLTVLWPILRPRPLLYEGHFRHWLLRPLVPLLEGLPVPDLDQPSDTARIQIRRTIDALIEGLRQGGNFILWPAGHVQHDGVERLGAALAASEILQAVPQANVVLVRTRGLWGSRFSYAYTGQAPDLLGELKRGLLNLLSNLLFFMPRRRLDITVEVIDRGRLPDLHRQTLNPWLEAWYNHNGPEAPTFVPYHFLFGPRTHDFPPPPPPPVFDVTRITEQTKEEIRHILEDKLHRPVDASQQLGETLLSDLGVSSLEAVDVTRAIEQRFGFAAEVMPTTLGDLWLLAQGLAERKAVQPAPAEWFRPLSDEGPLQIEGETLVAAFIARALAKRKDVAAADDLAGVLTYEKMLVGVWTLSRRLAQLPGDRVGLMLPASVACDLAFFALHLAGKLPVMLNWTIGPANLAHAAQVMSVTHVITSKTFLDRLGIQSGGWEWVYLEDLRAGIGRLELLRALLTVRWLPGLVRSRSPAVGPNQFAVILFTSGTERAPKVVPLTHGNILSDLRGGIEFFGLTRRDSLLGFLPPFHSFGLSVGLLLPLLTGLRVVHHPDPTDAARLARKIAAYQPTLLLCTPTFLGFILDRAQPDDLKSLRLIVVGAEKCSDTLRRRCTEVVPAAKLTEGYGITECSPVVSVNRPTANRPGTVGQPLPGVEVCVVDLETGAELPTGQTGMLLVRGPMVFPGYLDYDGASPFQERNSKRWYVTGDLAEVDAEGFIRLAGRLKRFLKVGGEMVSLGALEEPFARLYPPTREGPRVAVEGMETSGGPRIVLFSIEPITLREANALLHQEGFRGVLHVDEVRRLPAIPVLGTGKTDYKALRAMLAAEEKSRAGG
jgi:long-chain-fatty-acid--[acyl-carrier-protein] ligase